VTNLARLADEATAGQILITQRLHAEVEEHVEVCCRGSLTIRDSIRRKRRCSYAAHAGVSAGIKSEPSAGASKNVATITVSPPVGLKAEWTWP